jgi:hypothetical protein
MGNRFPSSPRAEVSAAIFLLSRGFRATVRSTRSSRRASFSCTPRRRAIRSLLSCSIHTRVASSSNSTIAPLARHTGWSLSGHPFGFAVRARECSGAVRASLSAGLYCREPKRGWLLAVRSDGQASVIGEFDVQRRRKIGTRIHTMPIVPFFRISNCDARFN